MISTSKSLLLFAAGIAAASFVSARTLRAETIFAKDVTVDTDAFDVYGKYTGGSGWYDVNKLWVGETEDGRSWDETDAPDAIADSDIATDASMCWAATASNMIQWCYGQVAAGTFVAGTPAGYDASRAFAARQQLSVYKTFCENWTDDGNTIANGLAWWLTGDGEFESVESPASEPTTTGGAYLANAADVSLASYIESIELIYDDNVSGAYSLAELSDGFKESFGSQGGVIGLAINVYNQEEDDVEGGHAITCWGCEFDEDGLLSALYVTDSDDCVSTDAYSADASALEMVMRRLDVTFIENDDADDSNEYGIAYLFDYVLGVDYRIDTVVTFSPLGLIPEPNAFGLFAGACALALAGTRRRRKAR